MSHFILYLVSEFGQSSHYLLLLWSVLSLSRPQNFVAAGHSSLSGDSIMNLLCSGYVYCGLR